jgi:nucleotide-binding universal stress UspA family protein
MKLLVPVTTRDASLRTAEKAMEIAKEEGATIKLLSLVKRKDIRAYKRYAKIWQHADGSAFMKTEVLIDGDEAARRLRNDAGTLLYSFSNALNKEGVQTESEVVVGNSYKDIWEAAKSTHADMIVLGNESVPPLNRCLGSLGTKRFVSEAPCPVLVVR